MGLQWLHAKPGTSPAIPQILRIKDTTQTILLLGLPVWIRGHFVLAERRTVPCLGENCPHCNSSAVSRPKLFGYAPVARLKNATGEIPASWSLHTLYVPSGAGEIFKPELIGFFISLKVESRGIRLLGARNGEATKAPKKPNRDSLPKPFPEFFDVRPYVEYLLTGHWPHESQDTPPEAPALRLRSDEGEAEAKGPHKQAS